jgi:hypothetical protein
MILTRMDKKQTEAFAAERGWQVESDQNGLKRVVIDGVVIASDNSYSSLSMSVAAKPKKVKKYRLTTTVKTRTSDVEVIVGDFDHSYEADAYLSENNLLAESYKVAEIEAEEIEG